MTRTLRGTALALCLAASLPARAAPRLPEPSRGLIAAYVLHGGAIDAVTGVEAKARGIHAAPGHGGRKGGAVFLDGDDSWVNLGSAVAPARFTVSAWIQPDEVGHPQAIVSSVRDVPEAAHRNMELRVERGGRLVLQVAGGQSWDSVQGRRAVSTERWTHVAATYDGTEAQLWVNGARDGDPLAVSYAQAPAPTLIGARPEVGGRAHVPGLFFHGVIEDVRIWDRALSEAELLAVAGRGPLPPPPPQAEAGGQK